MNTTRLTLLLAGALALAATARAEPRYVTLEVRFPAPGTNTLTLTEYETAELVSFPTVANPRQLWFKRGGDWYLRQDTNALIIAGPATIELRGTGGLATFRIYPESYPPDKAVLVAPGAGGAAITLECSTNLVAWQTATNGIYTNQPAAKFFRIKLDRIPPN